MALPTFTQFLEKLERIEWGLPKDIMLDRSSITSANGYWKVSYSIVEANSYHDLETMPLQVVVNVRYKDKHVSSWGCISNAENSEFIGWMAKLRVKLNNDLMKNERIVESQGEALWKEM